MNAAAGGDVLSSDAAAGSSQMFLSAKEKEEERRILLERQKHLEEVLRQKKETEAQLKSDLSDQEMVDSIFDFLPPEVGGLEGAAPVAYEV